MAGLFDRGKQLFGFGSSSSQDTYDTSVDSHPLSLEAAKVTVDFKKVVEGGSFATVYQGKYKGKDCAVKVFNTGVVRKDIERESQLASIIQHHPNVVLVHGLWYGNAANRLPDSQPALVIELCTTSLFKYLKEKRNKGEVALFKLATKLGILKDITSAMIHLHGKQIVHGDLAAANVLLNFNVKGVAVVAKVADFGQSRILDTSTARHVTTTHGKTDIMPPEVKTHSGPVEMTKAVDLFSFGCLIAHVASCVYPEPRADPLEGMTEYDKRAQYVSDNQKHVFESLMKRCLDSRPPARGTFEDVMGEVQIQVKKYSRNKQAETLEEKQREIEKMKSDLLTLERQHKDLQEQHAALDGTCRKVQDSESSMKNSWNALARERDTLADEKTTLELELVRANQEVLRMTQKVEDLEKDKEQSLHTVGSVHVVFQKYEDAKEEIAELKEAEKQLTSENQTLSQKHADSVATCRQYCEDKQALQNELARRSRELQGLQELLDSEKRAKATADQQKLAADKSANGLRGQLVALERKSKKTERDLSNTMTSSQQLTQTNQDMASKAKQMEKDLRQLNDKVASLDRQLSDAKRLKEATVRERDSARGAVETTKRELEACQVQLGKEEKQHQQAIENVKTKIKEIQRLREEAQKKDSNLWTVTKDRELYQGRASAGEATVKSQQEELKKAQKRVQELNDELRKYRDDLESTQNARDRHKQSEERLVDEKSTLEQQVRKLTFKLEAKSEENDKKQKEIYSLMKEVEVAQEVIEKGETLEPKLRQQIHELEDDNKDLVDKLTKKVGKLMSTESELKETKETQKKLEEERDLKIKSIRELEGELDRMASNIQELDANLSEMTARKDALERKYDEEERKRHLMQNERDSAAEEAAELKEQLKGLHQDHEKLRKEHILDLHTRTDFIEELWESEQQKDADLVSADVDYQMLQNKLKATAEERDKAIEQVELLQRSLSKVSAECEVKTKEKESIREHLKATRQHLKAKEKECYTFESAQLDLLQRCEELKAEKQQLDEQATQIRAERTKAEAENEALCNQLKDFAATKAENESLKNDAAEQTSMVKHWKRRAKKIKELENQLGKEQTELSTERKVVAELKKKLDREFVTKTNLESAVKQSFRESFTERGEELMIESGIVGSGSGGSEGSEDSVSYGGPVVRRDMVKLELLAQHSQQKIRDIEEGKWKMEEALGQKERYTLQLRSKLDAVLLENVQLRNDEQAAKRKAQGSDMKARMLADSYYQSHQYPPFLYQLHQKGLPSSGVKNTCKLCDEAMAEVSAITDLRLFHPDVSWCDELHFLLDELRAMPNMDRQACASISFLHCGGVITFYRFHVMLVPQVLSREPEIHPLQLEGGAIPKAILVYAHTQLNIKNLKKEFGISAHTRGILLSPQFEPDISELALRLAEMQLEDIPPGLEETEMYLDAKILHQLQCRYKEFATPRIVPTVPPMGVAMTVM